MNYDIRELGSLCYAETNVMSKSQLNQSHRITQIVIITMVEKQWMQCDNLNLESDVNKGD